MNDKVKTTIDYLNTWKDAFLNGTDWTFERNLGIFEIRDELSGISVNGQECFASYLFSQLSEKEKEYVSRNLDFYINFEELYAVYDI
jgi:hypothetical protein